MAWAKPSRSQAVSDGFGLALGLRRPQARRGFQAKPGRAQDCRLQSLHITTVTTVTTGFVGKSHSLLMHTLKRPAYARLQTFLFQNAIIIENSDKYTQKKITCGICQEVDQICIIVRSFNQIPSPVCI